MNQFLGVEHLDSKHFHDVEKNADVPKALRDYTTFLEHHFEEVLHLLCAALRTPQDFPSRRDLAAPPGRRQVEVNVDDAASIGEAVVAAGSPPNPRSMSPSLRGVCASHAPRPM